jgi:hypothetical protein
VSITAFAALPLGTVSKRALAIALGRRDPA